MKRPTQPPVTPAPCPRCGVPCRGHVLTGWCATCTAVDARNAMALERGAAGRTAPVVDAGAESRDWLEAKPWEHEG